MTEMVVLEVREERMGIKDMSNEKMIGINTTGEH